MFHSYYGIWIERAPARGAGAFRWTDVSPPAPDDYDALFYPPMEVHGRLVAKAGKTVFVSPDLGNDGSWAEIALPTSGGGDPDLASALIFADASTLFVGTMRGAVYRIAKTGAGWKTATVTPLKSPRASAS